MNTLVDTWLHSGMKREHLYKGSTDEITKEMKAWVDRRKAKNDIHMNLRQDMFMAMDNLAALKHRPGGPQRSQISASVVANMEALDRSRVSGNVLLSKVVLIAGVQTLDREREVETLQGIFLVSSFIDRGITLAKKPSCDTSRVDGIVCAFLGEIDPSFDTQMETSNLEDKERMSQWQSRLAARDSEHAQELIDDPIPGARPHQIGAVAAQYRQEITKDPTTSTTQALRSASNLIMGKGLMDFAMGQDFPLPIFRMGPTTGDETIDAATERLNDMEVAAGPSSGTTDNASDVHQGPGMSNERNKEKAKARSRKKNEGRKRAKARAKEAARGREEGGGDGIDDAEGDEDDKDDETPDLVEA